MKKSVWRWGLLAGLLTFSMYAIYGDSKIPARVLESLSLLKRPIEDLLPDLDQTSTTTPDDIELAQLDLDAYQDLHNSRERWNEMRHIIETGKPIYTPLPSEVVISTVPAGRLAPAVPPPPGFTVQLPYESRLTVSGRKVIGMTFRTTKFGNLTGQQGLPTSQSNFELQQQLQVRINGQVGRKVTVNVDFDDTKEDKKDISIVYKGDPDEVVQRAAFGDITLSLPQTEFAGYNKQLFGASAELKYKALKGYVIGSRTKGQTETKEFVGNVILNRIDVADTSYIRRRYYSVKKMTGVTGIVAGSESIFLDNRDVTRVNVSSPGITVDGSLVGVSSFTDPSPGGFNRLARGRDYTIDTTSGVITFSPNLNIGVNHVIAIDFTDPVNGRISNLGSYPGLLKILKFDESAISSVVPTEELTHYNLGTNRIVRDNGQGNFTLKVFDLNRNDIGSTIGIQYLPSINASQIIVDFDAGTFALTKRLDANNSNYSSVYNTSPSHLLTFFVEYRARVKTYTLRPNIVLNSERILMNGRQLTRDVDYFIDYQSGFITFFNEDQITESTRIVATYDFSPFGIAGAQQDTLVGARVESSMYPLSSILSQSYIGSTVLYDFAPQQTSAPNIRQTAGSFLVSEADVNFKDLIFSPIPLLKSSFKAEIARSSRNTNTFGKAIIDNMEGIKDETSTGLNVANWQVARNPITPTETGGSSAYFGALAAAMTNSTVKVLDINPNASALPGDQQQVLILPYDLRKSTSASIVTVLSPGGVDLSKKLYLEMYVQGDGTAGTPAQTGTQFDISLGRINEDADGTGGGGFTDLQNGQSITHRGPVISGGTLLQSGDGSPRTEDLNHNNTLDLNEDAGWTYYDPDGTPNLVGASNLRLDSEDLDRNGILDTAEVLAGELGSNNSSDPTQNINVGGSGPSTLDYSGWKFIRIPLNISSQTASNWQAVKDLRLTLTRGSLTHCTGTISIAGISIVGNRWQSDPPIVSGSSMSVKAIDNVDDLGYSQPDPNQFPDFNDLNQTNNALSGPTPTKKRETSLAIDYAFDGTQDAGSSVTTRSVYVAAMDLSNYNAIQFFLHGDTTSTNGGNEIFFFQAGSDTDYWEFRVPVKWANWREIRINQPLDSHQRVQGWESGIPEGSVNKVGNPNLASVSQFKVGIIKTTMLGAAQTGEVWFDELHVDGAVTRVGYASALHSDFEIMGWGTFGGTFRDIDRNFETFTSALTNQDRKEYEEHLNLTRMKYFPMQFSGIQSTVITPDVQTMNNTTLVSVQQDGEVDRKFYSAQGTLQLPMFPKLGLLYDTDKTATKELYRTDQTDHYGLAFDYAVPFKRAYLPKNISLSYKLTKQKIDFTQDALSTASDPYSVSNTRDKTEDWLAKLSFQPLNGFIFNPSYSFSQTTESKDAIVDTTTLRIQSLGDYNKARAQTAGLDGVLGIKRWLSPRVRYSITTRETYGIPLAADPTASSFKTVDRTATGETSWDVAWRDLTRKIRPLQSLNVSSSYLIEDGDSWQKVDSGYNSLNIFTIRQSLDPGNPDATRANLTLRDTFRSTQRLTPFDWATNWSGPALPLRTMSLTSTFTNTKQRQETTGTPSRTNTRILPDLLLGMTQTENFFYAQSWMSNSQMNLKTQIKNVETEDVSQETTKTWGGDWRFTIHKKLDLFMSYSRMTDVTNDLINNLVTNDALTETLGLQLGFNVGKWRISPKYDQSKTQGVNSAGELTSDLTTRTPAIQAYADLYIPAGLKLPFSDLIIFSNRIRTTSSLQLQQSRSSLNALANNTDTYTFKNSEDYELTSNVRLTFGGSYVYQVNKVSPDANYYSYEFDTLLTIQF